MLNLIKEIYSDYMEMMNKRRDGMDISENLYNLMIKMEILNEQIREREENERQMEDEEIEESDYIDKTSLFI